MTPGDPSAASPGECVKLQPVSEAGLLSIQLPSLLCLMVSGSLSPFLYYYLATYANSFFPG